MSTKSSLWYGVDEKGRDCHIYWELAERTPYKSAPIYLKLCSDNKEVRLRLPKELAQKVRDLLDPEPGGRQVE